MSLTNIISLFGGLGAFLFGMDYMGAGLKLVAGSKMKELLEKLTRKPIFGFLVGALVTCCIQSSSATTVMAMGFINAGIMDLAQAAGVIFGANVGTTITSILIALDISGIAPLCIAIGALLRLYSKRKKANYIGQVILGFGLLFQGLHTMSGSMAPLKDSAVFQNFILNAKNPILGFLIGAVLCAIIQSSSAAVGILQALAMQGLMPLSFAGFIVCGINVGSSTPVVISSLNAKNNAKRAAIIYLLFNVIGTVIMVPLSMATPLISAIETHVPSPAFQVSMYHILFKLITGVILIPLTNMVVKLTYRILPKQAHESAFRLEYIDKNFIGDPHVMAVQISKEVLRAAGIVKDNVIAASEALLNLDLSKAHIIRDNEELADFLTEEINGYITKINTTKMTDEVSAQLVSSFQCMNELEQIGDHCIKILGQAEKCAEEKLVYSEEARDEFRIIYEQDIIFLDKALKRYEEGRSNSFTAEAAKETEAAINKLSSIAQSDHMERMRLGLCSPGQGLTYVEALNSLSRIANHTTAIAETLE